MKNITTNPKSAAILGLLFVLPFLIMNFIVVFKPDPIYSFMGPIGFISSTPWPVVLLILLILVGALITVRPMLPKGTDGKRKFHLVNAIIAAILFAEFILLAVGLRSEIYRCDGLHLPNCD